MSAVKTWIFSLCTASIVGAIIQMMVPKGSMEKVMRVVVGIFFLSCIFVPLFEILPGIKYDFESGSSEEIQIITQNMEDVTVSQTIDFANIKITDAIAKTLDRNNINYKKIAVNYNISDVSDIYINEIQITMENQHEGQADKAMELLEKETGIKTFVSVEEG